MHPRLVETVGHQNPGRELGKVGVTLVAVEIETNEQLELGR